jgi:membrane-associated phospholipid phosphatase
MPGVPAPIPAPDAPPGGRGVRLVDRRWVLPAEVALFTVACALVGWLAVRVPEGARLDDAAFDGRAALPWEAELLGTRLLETISVGSLAVLTLACATVAVLRGRPRAALAAGVLVLGANVTTQLLKHEILDGHGTFPSGHATVGMSLALASLLVAPPGWRSLVALGGTGYAAAVGGAVVVAGWHRPSEAVAGFLVAGAWALVVVPVAQPRRARVDATRLAVVAGASTAVLVVGTGLAGALRYAGDGVAGAALVAALGCVAACALLVEGVVATTSAPAPVTVRAVEPR